MEKIIDYGFIYVVWTYLLSHFGNKTGVAALMGNFYGESYVVPYIVQNNLVPPFKKSQEYTDKLDAGIITRTQFINSGGGYGFAQWTIPERKAPFYDFVKLTGESFGAWEVGCAFAISELESGQFNASKEAIYNPISLEESVRIILRTYEMPQDKSENAVKRRTNFAQQIYDMMVNSTTFPPVEKEYINVTPKSIYVKKNAVTTVNVNASDEWDCDLGSDILIQKKTNEIIELTTASDKEEERTATFYLKNNHKIKIVIPLGLNIIIPVEPEKICRIDPKSVQAYAMQIVDFFILASGEYDIILETGATIIEKTAKKFRIRIDNAYSRPDIHIVVYLKNDTTVKDNAVIHIVGGGSPPVSGKKNFKVFTYVKPRNKL